MRAYCVSVFIVFVFLSASVKAEDDALQGPQSDCPDICTFDYKPVCGYDGTCYHIYGNQCTLNSDRCKKKQALKDAEMKLCEEALAKTNPELIACELE